MSKNKPNSDAIADKISSLQGEISGLSSKLAEKEKLYSQLRAYENFFHILFEKTDEACCICNSTGKILKINQNAANLLGNPATEILNHSILLLLLLSSSKENMGMKNLQLSLNLMEGFLR